MYSASAILVKARTYYIPSRSRVRKTKVSWGTKKHRFYHADREYYRNVYLKSSHWKDLRQKKLQANPMCEECGSTNRVEPHHINYKSLYNVDLADLKTLCRVCHNKVHTELDTQKRTASHRGSSKVYKRELKLRVRHLQKETGISKQIIRQLIREGKII
jgi:5-methylcytosine-specific restriction endonuclease McrA